VLSRQTCKEEMTGHSYGHYVSIVLGPLTTYTMHCKSFNGRA
jgi:hypothetical protein